MKITSAMGSSTSGALLLVLVVCALDLSNVIERAEADPACYGGSAKAVLFTQYWVPKEGSQDVDQDGNVISLSGPATKHIKQADGTVIESTDTNTYSKCLLEGTCLLLNGDLINVVDSGAETFQILDKSQFPYGQGSSGKALEPFVSVAANDLKKGTTLFVSKLKNFVLPNGKTHNGCVRVDDTGSGDNFKCHIDWFVSSYDDYAKMSDKNQLPDKATVQERSCQVQTYV